MGRFITNLFKPKEIGRYINDHIGFVVCYLLFFVVLCSIPDCVDTINSPKVSYSSEIVLFNSFNNKAESNYIITGEGLSLKDETVGIVEEVYNGTNISIAFNSLEVNNVVVIIFRDTYINVYYQRVRVSTLSYSDLNVSALDVNDIKGDNFVTIDKFVSIINVAYDSVLRVVVPTAVGSIIIQNIILFAFLLFILAWFSASFNPAVDLIHRLKVCAYALTWGYIFNFLAIITGVGILFYIGVIISFIFSIKALRNIVKIQIRK